MFPENPALQAQPSRTLVPELVSGQVTAKQVSMNQGSKFNGVIDPLRPGLQMQP